MVETDTRFEKARIIGARALQISCGAPAFTDVETARMLDPIDIAEAEYDSGFIPISVIRK
ncbi:MAG: DNA-directed RNA polymerase subunit K [Thermoplasmata archaeon]|jgi:DNA-directed RNA polymerase subunit K/omega|nr:DNA-directed RNA polymerase subunit K [Thermoplasmata archaeon]